MKFIGIELHGEVVDADDSPAPEDVLDRLTDDLAEQLMSIADAIDPEVDAALARGELRVRLYVKALHSVDAFQKAQQMITTAMLNIGMKPEWGEARRPQGDPIKWDFDGSGWVVEETTDERLITA